MSQFSIPFDHLFLVKQGIVVSFILTRPFSSGKLFCLFLQLKIHLKGMMWRHREYQRNKITQHHTIKKEFQMCFDQWKTHWNVLNVKGTILKKIIFHPLLISVLVIFKIPHSSVLFLKTSFFLGLLVLYPFSHD